MQIEYLHVNRGENIVTFDTDTDEGRKKLANEFSRMVRSGTPVMLELGGPGGETYRIQRYDPAKDRLHIAVTSEQAAPPDSEPVDEDYEEDEIEVEESSPAKEPGPGVTEPDSSVPEELKGCVAKVGEPVDGRREKEVGQEDAHDAQTVPRRGRRPGQRHGGCRGAGKRRVWEDDWLKSRKSWTTCIRRWRRSRT